MLINILYYLPLRNISNNVYNIRYSEGMKQWMYVANTYATQYRIPFKMCKLKQRMSSRSNKLWASTV